MKMLHYRRHSIKDGAVKDTIGPKGLELAVVEGRKVWQSGHVINALDGSREDTIRFDSLFHGPMVRTAQSALAFCQGLGYVLEIMPVVEEIGTQELMVTIGTPAFQAAYKANGGNAIAATREVFGDPQTRVWAQTALNGVEKMLAQMNEGETAIAFGHSPIIDLAAWTLVASQDEVIQLAEMEGFVFLEVEVDPAIGKVTKLGDKISVARETVKA